MRFSSSGPPPLLNPDCLGLGKKLYKTRPFPFKLGGAWRSEEIAGRNFAPLSVIPCVDSGIHKTEWFLKTTANKEQRTKAMTKIITRFAPSPTGHLHIGGARTAIFCWLMARNADGKFYLRIEDTDRERSLQEYTDSILASMRWLGLDWDGEPIYQHTRMDLYNSYIDRLLASGHAYWCDCTPEAVEAMREDARAKGLKPKYNGCCRERGLGPGPDRVVRFKAPLTGQTVVDDLVKGQVAVDNAEMDDMVLRRPDNTPTYNLAVVVDDAEMGITHVLRGDDHLTNTPRQILIYQALGLPLPKFGHVPMILGPDKQKLSKRHGAKAVIEYEKDGLLPEALVNYLVRLGWSHGDDEIFTLRELIDKFPQGRLSASPSAFDPEKLAWLNGQHLKVAAPDRLAELLRPFLLELGLTPPEGERLAGIIELFRDRATGLKDMAAAMRFMLVPAAELHYDEMAVDKALPEEGRVHVAALAEAFRELSAFTPENIHAAMHGYVETGGLKMKQVGPPLRVALVGALAGPGLPEIMAWLGKDESLARLARAASL